MESTIITSTLSDGSEVYAVVFVDGSLRATIAAIDLKAAESIQAALLDGCYATIDGELA